MTELGRRVRRAREQRGMTQRQAAEAAKIATDMISRIENGRYTSPGLRTLLRIADGLGTSVAALLPGSDTVGPDVSDSPQQARIGAILQRCRANDLDLIADIAQTIVTRRR